MLDHRLVEDLKPAEIFMFPVGDGDQTPPAGSEYSSELSDGIDEAERICLRLLPIWGVKQGIIEADMLEGRNAHDGIESPIAEFGSPEIPVDVGISLVP